MSKEQTRTIIQSLTSCFTGAPASPLTPSPAPSPPPFLEREKAKMATAAMTTARGQPRAQLQRSLAPNFEAVGAPCMAPATGSSAEASAIVALEHALTKSGSAAAIRAAVCSLMSENAVFSSPIFRVAGRNAISRSFRLWQVLFVDDVTVDAVGVGELAPAAGSGAGGLFGPPPLMHAEWRASPGKQLQPRRIGVARLTHRLYPRFLDALAGPARGAAPSVWESDAGGEGGEGAVTFQLFEGQTITRQGAPAPPHAHRVSAASASSPSAPVPSAAPALPAPLAYLFSWLRARLTFTVVDNAVYVFEAESDVSGGGRSSGGGSGTSAGGGGGGGGGTGFAPPRIASIRSEIALVSLVYALPFGALVWHGAAEPAMGAAAQVADAVWGTWVRPWALPWARQAFGYAGLDML